MILSTTIQSMSLWPSIRYAACLLLERSRDIVSSWKMVLESSTDCRVLYGRSCWWPLNRVPQVLPFVCTWRSTRRTLRTCSLRLRMWWRSWWTWLLSWVIFLPLLVERSLLWLHKCEALLVFFLLFCLRIHNKKNTQLDIIPYTISIDLNVFTDGQDLPQINMLSVEVLKEGLLNDSFWE